MSDNASGTSGETEPQPTPGAPEPSPEPDASTPPATQGPEPMPAPNWPAQPGQYGGAPQPAPAQAGFPGGPPPGAPAGPAMGPGAPMPAGQVPTMAGGPAGPPKDPQKAARNRLWIAVGAGALAGAILFGAGLGVGYAIANNAGDGSTCFKIEPGTGNNFPGLNDNGTSDDQGTSGHFGHDHGRTSATSLDLPD